MSKMRQEGVLDWIGQDYTYGPHRPINVYALHVEGQPAPEPLQAPAAPPPAPPRQTIRVEGTEYEVCFSGGDSLTPKGYRLGSSLGGGSYRVVMR